MSKTQLRAALRQYTSSWRYLHGVKPGAERVDLDGNPCGTLEQEHVEHAQNTLAESKAKVQARRKEKQKQEKNNAQPKTRKPNPKAKTAKRAQEKTVQPRALNADELSVGRQVKVNMGKGNMAATIVEINKEDVRVQLGNGLQMVVKAEYLSA